MQINLLPNLSLNNDGHLVNQIGDEIHLRQGDMDGACGPYCVVMSLLARNKARRDEFLPLNNIDYRTRAGRLLKELRSKEPMVLSGMDETELEALYAAYNTATSRVKYGSGKELLKTASSAIRDGCPVIVCIQGRRSERLSHWTLAVGTCNDCLYLLDPAYDLPVGSYWNAMITLQPTSNRFGYRYVNPWYCQDIEVGTILEVS